VNGSVSQREREGKEREREGDYRQGRKMKWREGDGREKGI
jgi:hypothetical protein